MNLYTSVLEIKGSPLEGENPMPIFRGMNHHRDVNFDESFKEEHKHMLGWELGVRYLPYRNQDRYNRVRKNILLKTIILENDFLKVTFLPEYGGRIYSLEDKIKGKDLLYKNPVLQPANLAILDAWFSGGIEWNVGHIGHAFTTCSPVFVSKLCNPETGDFLRIYEYERCKNIFWHIDFHLPRKSDKLLIYARIVNDSNNSVPMYWWTNIAAMETSGARVFSDADDVIYLDTNIKGFRYHDMPYLPSVPGVDHSYPMRIPHSTEYFFQTSTNLKSPWEAVSYEDGMLLYERSTALLRYRKLFCWGNHPGGMHWKDFLSNPGEGNYIEIQGGLTPTQLHGIDMPARSEWDFTQIIGAAEVDPERCKNRNWNEARDYVRGKIDVILPADEVERIHFQLQSYKKMKARDILNMGSGWGALEKLRRQMQKEEQIPQGFEFPESSMGEQQHPWLLLLQEKKLPLSDTKEIPVSWMIQNEWKDLLAASLKDTNKKNWNAWLHYGVILLEIGKVEEAIKAWKNSIKMEPSAWAYRNIAVAMRRRGELQNACSYMEKAGQLDGGFPDVAFVQEYLTLLIQNTEYKKAWQVYKSLPPIFAENERVLIIMGAVALELGEDDFMQKLFCTELSVIREGEVAVVGLWYRYHAEKLAREKNIKMSEDLFMEAATKYPPPRIIDFTLSDGQIHEYYEKAQK